MKKNALKLIAVLCAASIVGAAFAQGGQGGQGGGQGRGQGGGMRGMQGMRGGGGHLQMLSREDVAADLKLTDDQKAKIKALNDKMGEERRAARQNGGGGGGNGGGFDQAAMQAMIAANQKMAEKYNKEAATILTADQNKRFLGIRIQLAGNNAVADAEVQKAINFTDAQKAKLKELNDKAQAANQSIMEKMRNQEIEREAAMESFQKNQEVLATETAKILTEEQKAKLKELSGAKFEAREQGRGGAGGRGGNGGGGGGRGGNGGGF